MSSKPQPSPWADAPVGAFGIGCGILGAALSVAGLKLPAWIAVVLGMVLGLVAQVALMNLLFLIDQRMRQKLVPRVVVDTRDSVVVIRVSYAREVYCEAEMSPDGAMQLARSLVGSALEIDQDSEHRIELQ